jgi:murein DD-endopeptidase MepM/ murein hydrolase activator NlpD
VGFLALAAGLALGAGCASAPTRAGIYHRVQAGENLYRIGKAYGLSVVELSRINQIEDAHRLRVGQELFIPGGSAPLPVRIITPTRVDDERPRRADMPPGGGRPFRWPIGHGTLTSRFGPRGDTHHDGIDIGAPRGTPVYAARDGEVLYSAKLAGYGNVIIIAHGAGYATVYAHNSAHLVRTGERVRQRQRIAHVGESGRTSGPNLHFEVRKDNVARNPLYYLPPLRRAAGAAAGG